MAFEVTATRKRPQLFEQLAGQDFVVSTLENSVREKRIANAYLFSGPRGVGKTSAARILAKALNCDEGPTATPCGTCESCREISSGNSLDVIEIDGASNTSVNDVREIKDEVLFAPNSSRYKVYIIDEVHMLSNSAFNALLKTIEEPPPYIVFIFATTEIHKVPATIRSRCQQFTFHLIPIEVISERLRGLCEENGLSAETEALFWIAKEATGSLRDAYTLFDQIVSFSRGTITMELIKRKLGLVGLDRLNEIAELLVQGKTDGVLSMVDEALGQGIAIERFIIDLTEYFRNLLFLKAGIRREAILGYPPDSYSPRAVEGFTLSQVERAIDLLLELYRDIRYSLNQRFELELLMSRLAALPGYISTTEMLSRIEGLRRAVASGGGGAAQAGYREDRRPAEPADTAANAEEPVSIPDADGHEEPVPDTDEAMKSTAIGRDTIENLIGTLRPSHLALSSALSKASAWLLEGDVLRITFGDNYSASFVRRDLNLLTAKIRDILGIPVRIDISTDSSGKKGSGGEDVSVEIVKKVFRGEIVQGE